MRLSLVGGMTDHLVHTSRSQRGSYCIADRYYMHTEINATQDGAILRYTPFAATIFDNRTSMGLPYWRVNGLRESTELFSLPCHWKQYLLPGKQSWTVLQVLLAVQPWWKVKVSDKSQIATRHQDIEPGYTVSKVLAQLVNLHDLIQ